MVTVTAYQERTSTEGKKYIALEIQSDDLEFVVSKVTGRHYATVRKCWISSTFNEVLAERMLGKEMQGSIVKTACEPYEFTIPETGEVITRHHRYDYSPLENGSMEEVVLQNQEPAFA
ncbi:MAG: hypothetical protein MUF45_01350 [Spirosomaceae bacterium]|jgi:hypothetical protein|nr:hypothetical protein [Spirosomataceae bacterium]